MSESNKPKISQLGSQITSVISVTLVLLTVGILCYIGITARRVSHSLKENVSLTVRMDPSADDEDAAGLHGILGAAPYVATYVYLSADSVYAQELALSPEIAEFDENPFSAEYDITLKPAYVHTDSLSAITAQLRAARYVDEIITPTDAIDSINNLLNKAALAMTFAGIVLLFISIVLIYNTVSVTIYARRFIINTMQLVGATPWFVRRPFVMRSLACAVISSLLASAILLLIMYYAGTTGIDVLAMPTMAQACALCGILLVIGIVICSLAAWCATTKYLKANDDKLYN